jgi:N-acetylmuramoyl-L-alanine amidase
MSKINLFLQKIKIREKHHGVILIITAYALSFFMLILGSDTFYDIRSSAAGTKQEEDSQITEKVQDIVNTNETSASGENLEYQGVTQTLEIHNSIETQESAGNLLSLQYIQPKVQALKANLVNPYGLNEAIEENTLASGTETEPADQNTEAEETAAAKKEKAKKEAASDKEAETAKKDGEEKDKTTESLSVEDADSPYVVSVTKEDVDMLERIVEAEASGEDMVGKILVANVILNRISDDEFPDTVEKVIFQKVDGEDQFTPIADERFWEVTVSDDTEEAVLRALEGEDYSKGALYYVKKACEKKQYRMV